MFTDVSWEPCVTHIIWHYLPFLQALILHRIFFFLHVYILLLNTSTGTENVKQQQCIGHNVLLCVVLHSTVSHYEYFRAFADNTVTQNRMNYCQISIEIPMKEKTKIYIHTFWMLLNEYFHILDWCNEKCYKINIDFMMPSIIPFLLFLNGKKWKY